MFARLPLPPHPRSLRSGRPFRQQHVSPHPFVGGFLPARLLLALRPLAGEGQTGGGVVELGLASVVDLSGSYFLRTGVERRVEFVG